MLPSTVTETFARQLDKLALYTMNYRLPDSFEDSYQDAPTFEAVLRQTAVNLERTAVYGLYAPGERSIWLNTMNGELLCHAKVRLSLDPQAPLLLYHHGFNESPYYRSWQRLFSHPFPLPVHTVCVQAPFHSSWGEPLTRGFSSVQSVYQIFAGSLRIMELIQSHFETRGAAYTVLAGASWGGITSLLYEGFFQQARAVIPMLSSPDLAQVMWDIATLFERPVAVPRATIKALFDFTPYYRRGNVNRVFPLLAENDLFFRIENHADVFGERPLVTIPDSHVTGFWRLDPLRQHVIDVLEWAENNPL